MKRLLNSNLNLALIFSGLCFSNISRAQTEDSVKRTLQLEQFTINALSIPVGSHQYGGMVGVISSAELNYSDPTLITEQFNTVPGVLMQSGTYTTNRISIRGVGSRSAFGTNKIRAYLGEIPLTDGGGETTIEDIDLSFIGSAQIIKGPNSSIYGSGLGGAILLSLVIDTLQHAEVKSTVGSFGLFRLGGMSTVVNENSQLTVGLQRQIFDGYRQNNQSRKHTFLTTYRKQNDRKEWQFLTLYQGLKAYIPSSIGISDYTENPRRAASNWAGAQGYEDYEKWLLGLALTYRLSDQWKWSNAIYANWKSNYEPRPFNILSDQLSGMGMRSRLRLEKEAISMNIGVEGFTDQYKWRTFEILVDPLNPGSEQGDLLSKNKEHRSYFNSFAQAILQLGQNTSLEGGINVNLTSYQFESQTEKYTKSFEPVISPRLSLVQELTNEINIFGTVSHGFSPPSVDETLNESGGFNVDIQPETGWNRELGIKGAHQRVMYALSYYWMDIQNLLVTRRTAQDITFGKNAGSTKHHGLEAEAEMLLLQNSIGTWKIQGSYALNKFTFRKFKDDGENYSGNKLTGVPAHQWNMTLSQQGNRWFSGLNFLAVGAIPITDNNEVFTASYLLANAYLGMKFFLANRLNASISYRMNNVFDERYASMIGVNAQGFGALEPRYYYPGMSRNHQLSIIMGY